MRQALKILKEDYYDLVISDIRMPKMDGLALLNEIGQLFLKIADFSKLT